MFIPHFRWIAPRETMLRQQDLLNNGLQRYNADSLLLSYSEVNQTINQSINLKVYVCTEGKVNLVITYSSGLIVTQTLSDPSQSCYTQSRIRCLCHAIGNLCFVWFGQSYSRNGHASFKFPTTKLTGHRLCSSHTTLSQSWRTHQNNGTDHHTVPFHKVDIFVSTMVNEHNEHLLEM